MRTEFIRWKVHRRQEVHIVQQKTYKVSQTRHPSSNTLFCILYIFFDVTVPQCDTRDMQRHACRNEPRAPRCTSMSSGYRNDSVMDQPTGITSGTDWTNRIDEKMDRAGEPSVSASACGNDASGQVSHLVGKCHSQHADRSVDQTIDDHTLPEDRRRRPLSVADAACPRILTLIRPVNHVRRPL